MKTSECVNISKISGKQIAWLKWSLRRPEKKYCSSQYRNKDI